MNVNVFFDVNGISIIEVFEEDFLTFLNDYIKTKLSKRDSYKKVVKEEFKVK